MATLALCQRELKPLVSRNNGRVALKEALELYVGYRGAKRRFTMQQLSEGAGVKARVIECAMEEPDSDEYRNIGIGDLLSLCAFLGTSFTSNLLELAGQGAFDLMDQPPLDHVLTSPPQSETVEEKRKRLIRELAALEEA